MIKYSTKNNWQPLLIYASLHEIDFMHINFSPQQQSNLLTIAGRLGSLVPLLLSAKTVILYWVLVEKMESGRSKVSVFDETIFVIELPPIIMILMMNMVTTAVQRVALPGC